MHIKFFKIHSQLFIIYIYFFIYIFMSLFCGYSFKLLRVSYPHAGLTLR